MAEGRPKVYHGTVGVVSADNLGSLALGGFKESCSANRMCRHCLATKATAQLADVKVYVCSVCVCMYSLTHASFLLVSG